MKEGEEYEYGEEGFSIRFTDIDEDVSEAYRIIALKEVTLTEEQQEALGAVSDTAYDVISPMENESFEYEIILPTPEGSSEDSVEVVYAEDEKSLNDTEKVKPVKKDTVSVDDNGTKTKVKDLDHFTIFVAVGTKTSTFAEASDAVVINAFLFDPVTGSEWVELYNKDNDVKDLNGWTLEDDANHNLKTFSSGENIPANGFIMVGGITNKLNNDGDTITLKNGSGDPVSQVTYSDTGSEITIDKQDIGVVKKGNIVERSEDGGSDWEVGTSVYVDSSYAGDEYGTEDFPFNTIQEGIDAVGEGGTVHVIAGTYAESVLIKKKITLQGSGEERPIVSGGSSNFILKIANDNVIVDNLEINGGGEKVGDNNFDYGILVSDADDVEIKNSVVKNIWKSSGNGVGIENSLNSKIHNNIISSFHKRGIRYVYSSGELNENEIMGESVDGETRVQNLINLWTGSSVEIHNNELHGARTVGEDSEWGSVAIFISSYAGSYGDEEDSTANVHDNEIYSCDVGLTITSEYSSSDSSNAVIENNNFHDLDTVIDFEGSTGSAAAHNNKFLESNVFIDAELLDESIDAENNWWGSAEFADIAPKISGEVDYDPWCLDEDCSKVTNYTKSKTATLSETEGEDVLVGSIRVRNVKGLGELFVAKYDGEPESGGFSVGVDGLYYDIQYSGEIDFPVKVIIRYDDTDFDEDKFVSLFYYDEDAGEGEWKDYRNDDPASTVEIDTDENKITAYLQHLTPIVPVVDTEAPAIPSASMTAGGENIPDKGYTNSENFTFNLTSSSTDVVRYQLKYWNAISGDKYEGEVKAWNPKNLSEVYNDRFSRGEGVHYFAFSACDVVGNCSEYSEPFEVTYDATPPEKPMGLQYKTLSGDVLGCGVFTNQQEIVADWADSSEEDLSHYEYRAFNFQSSTPWETDVYGMSERSGEFMKGDGMYGFAIRTVDMAGNASDWTANELSDETTCQITYDTTPPEVTLASPVEGYVSGTVPIEGTVTDANPHHYYLVIKDDSGKNIAGPGEVPDTSNFSGKFFDWDTTKVADGEYEIRLAARDSADNKDNSVSRVIRNVIVDNTDPVVSDIALNGETVTSTDIRNDNCEAIQKFYPVSGEIDFEAFIEDNLTDVTSTHYFIRKVNSNGCSRTDIYKSGKMHMTEGDDNRWSGSFDTTSIPDDGEYTIQLITKDGAGNQTMKYVDILVDNVNPIITNADISKDIVKDSDSPVLSADVDGTGSNVARAQYRIHKEDGSKVDGFGWVDMDATDGNFDSEEESIEKSVSIIGLDDGNYIARIRAFDSAGNKKSGVDVPFTVDNTAPTLESKTDFGSMWYGTSQTSVFVYSDPNLVSEYTDPTCDITTEGASQTCSVTPSVCDEAGNCNTAEVMSNGANIDFTDPESTIDRAENNGIIYESAWDGNITGTASDALSGVEKVMLTIQRESDDNYYNGASWQGAEVQVEATGTTTWSYALGSLPEDSYTITSRATDNAGNVENTYSVTIVYDKTIPEVVLTIDPSGPDGDNGWYVSTPEITLTASDNFDLERIEYKFDGDADWTVYSEPVSVPDGERTFSYRAIDKAENTSDTGTKSVKVDTEEPNEVDDITVSYEDGVIELRWDTDDSDIHDVYLYRGREKTFTKDRSSLTAKIDGDEDEYDDDNVEPGDKLYYKLMSRDEAGNTSNSRIVSVEIPEEEGGEIIVVDEGIEITDGIVAGQEDTAENPSEQELSQSDGEIQENNNEVGDDNENKEGGSVLGDEIEQSKQNSSFWSWIMWIVGGGLIGSFLFRLAKRKGFVG